MTLDYFAEKVLAVALRVETAKTSLEMGLAVATWLLLLISSVIISGVGCQTGPGEIVSRRGDAFFRLFFGSSCSWRLLVVVGWAVGQKFQKPPWYKILLIPTWPESAGYCNCWDKLACARLASVRGDTVGYISKVYLFFIFLTALIPIHSYPLPSKRIQMKWEQWWPILTYCSFVHALPPKRTWHFVVWGWVWTQCAIVQIHNKDDAH